MKLSEQVQKEFIEVIKNNKCSLNSGLFDAVPQFSLLGKKGPSIDDYEIGETLGSGNYGVVKAVTHKKTGMQLALKIYDK